jgi:hypothetical protein
MDEYLPCNFEVIGSVHLSSLFVFILEYYKMTFLALAKSREMALVEDIARVTNEASKRAKEFSDRFTFLNSLAPRVSELDGRLAYVTGLYTTLKSDPNANVKSLTRTIELFYIRIRQERKLLDMSKEHLILDREYILHELKLLTTIKEILVLCAVDITSIKSEALNSITVASEQINSYIRAMEAMDFENTPVDQSLTTLERNLKQAIPPIGAAA